MIKTLFFSLLIFWVSMACAANKSFTMGLHLVSTHDVEGFENNNPGFYLQYQGLTVGSFNNSLRKRSSYAGYSFHQRVSSAFVESVALTVGVVSGYNQKIGNSDVSGLLVPSVALRSLGGFRPRIAYLPAIGGVIPSTTVHLMVERKF
jgi:hypothetical protein